MRQLVDFLFKNTSVKQTIAKNTFWLIAAEIASRLLKMMLVVYAARILGAEGWGAFSYALSIGSILMIFSDIGIGGLITREAVQLKDGYASFISTSLFLKSAILCASILLVVLLGPHISHIAEARPLFGMIAIILVFDALRETGFAVNRAFEKMEWEIVVKILMSALTLWFGIMLLKSDPSPESFALAYAIGSALGFFLIAIVVRKRFLQIISRIDLTLLGTVIKTTWPFALITLVGSIMANTDVVMLGIWKNSAEIGLYASMQRIQQFILIIPSMIGTASFPLISRLAHTDKGQLGNIFERTLRFMFLIAIPIVVGGMLLSGKIVVFTFGAAYAGAAPILSALLLMLLVSFPLILLSNAIFAFDKQRELARAYFFGVIANILANFFLIPKFGAVGSAWATVVSTAIVTFVVWRKVNREASFRIVTGLRKIIIATICMATVISVINYFGGKLILTMLAGMLVYIFCLILLREPLLKDIRTILPER